MSIMERLFGVKKKNSQLTANTGFTTIKPNNQPKLEEWIQLVGFGINYSIHRAVEEDGDFIGNYKRSIILDAQAHQPRNEK